jgi:multiple sugar transport system permease protein
MPTAESRSVLRSVVRWSGPLLWVAPASLFVLCFAFYPLWYAIYISFFSYRLTDPLQVRTFVGLGNYLKAWGDPVFRVALGNTLLFVVLAVASQMVLGLAIAVLLNRDRAGSSLIRTLLLAPLTLTPLVVALVWKALYNTDFGVVSYYLKQVGIDVGRGPVAEPSWALISLVVVDIWQWTPLVALMLLASLRSQSAELYEAAEVDGASGWQRFLYIALPLLRPVIIVALLMRTMDVFKIFDSVFAVTGGGPGHATEVLNHYIFKTGLVFFDMGYAAAMSNLLLVLIGLFSAAYFRAIGQLESSG